MVEHPETGSQELASPDGPSQTRDPTSPLSPIAHTPSLSPTFFQRYPYTPIPTPSPVSSVSFLSASLANFDGQSAQPSIQSGTGPVALQMLEQSENVQILCQQTQAMLESRPSSCLIAQLCLLAGLDRTEIQKLCWEWIDFEAKTITIPPGTSNNATALVIPIGSVADFLAEHKQNLLNQSILVPDRPFYASGQVLDLNERNFAIAFDAFADMANDIWNGEAPPPCARMEIANGNLLTRMVVPDFSSMQEERILAEQQNTLNARMNGVVGDAYLGIRNSGIRTAILLHVNFGLSMEEIKNLRWDWLNFETETIIIPPGMAGNTQRVTIQVGNNGMAALMQHLSSEQSRLGGTRARHDLVFDFANAEFARGFGLQIFSLMNALGNNEQPYGHRTETGGLNELFPSWEKVETPSLGLDDPSQLLSKLQSEAPPPPYYPPPRSDANAQPAAFQGARGSAAMHTATGAATNAATSTAMDAATNIDANDLRNRLRENLRNERADVQLMAELFLSGLSAGEIKQLRLDWVHTNTINGPCIRIPAGQVGNANVIVIHISDRFVDLLKSHIDANRGEGRITAINSPIFNYPPGGFPWVYNVVIEEARSIVNENFPRHMQRMVKKYNALNFNEMVEKTPSVGNMLYTDHIAMGDVFPNLPHLNRLAQANAFNYFTRSSAGQAGNGTFFVERRESDKAAKRITVKKQIPLDFLPLSDVTDNRIPGNRPPLFFSDQPPLAMGGFFSPVQNANSDTNLPRTNLPENSPENLNSEPDLANIPPENLDSESDLSDTPPENPPENLASASNLAGENSPANLPIDSSTYFHTKFIEKFPMEFFGFNENPDEPPIQN
jgi:integrase